MNTKKTNQTTEKDRLARLAQALRSEPTEADCQTCINQLDDYIAAQLAGKNYVAQFPRVTVHLDNCIACAEAYARLYDLEVAINADLLPEIAKMPSPDLSFLAQPTKVTNLADVLRQSLTQLGNRFTLKFSADMLALLVPPPATVPTRAPTDSVRYSNMFFSLKPNESMQSEFPATISIFRDNEEPSACLIEVAVAPENRTWPDLAGIEVTFSVDDDERTAITDPWGLVSFADIPIERLGDMSIDITL